MSKFLVLYAQGRVKGQGFYTLTGDYYARSLSAYQGDSGTD